MPITINHGFPVPTESQANDVPADISALAVAIDQELSFQSPLESRPAAGHQGRFYFATTRLDPSTGNPMTWNVMYRDTGYGWNQVSDAAPVPVGTCIDFAGGSIPPLYLLCDGSLKSRVKYASLFAAIGDSWGAGDGSTTFALPNTVGRVARGASGPGGYGGQDQVSLSQGQMPPHNHTIGGDGGNRIVVTAAGAQQNNLTGPANPGVTFSHLDNAGGNGSGGVDPVPTLPAFVGMPKLIKAF